MELDKLLIYVQVALGIGLVIFVHELGHFLAARLCGVRVEVFSLGFGPKLLAWKRGATTYQIALLPLGGFVRMGGEDRLGSAEPLRSDDLPSKSVGARFLIYSGGVLMNVVFGLVVFPLVLFHGVPFMEPIVGDVQPGGPAWRAGIEPGTRILSINGNPIVGFEYIGNEVALGPSEAARLVVIPPGETEPREVVARPEYDEQMGFNRLHILPAYDESLGLQVEPESAAARAGLQTGDRPVAVHGDLALLPLTAQLTAAMQDGGVVKLTVERTASDGTLSRKDIELQPDVQPMREKVLGLSPIFGRVVGVRANHDLAALGISEGDLLLAVDGSPIVRPLDFERALLAGDAQARSVTFRVSRAGRELELQSLGPLDGAQRLALNHDIAVSYDTQGQTVVVTPRSAAASAGVRDGDRVMRVGGELVKSWNEVRTSIKAHRGGEPLVLDIKRTLDDGSAEVVTLAATLAPAERIDYGVGFHVATYVYQASGFADAVQVGVASSWKFVVDTWLTLKRILFGQVSSENISGPISIAVITASWAEEGVAKLLFILCMLSMNLAFINVLTIPVLDGGHLFFLVVEKIKGSPVSDRVLGYSQVVGVVLILSLMIYVTYNDLARWVF
jgi:regulator of sigma E protease